MEFSIPGRIPGRQLDPSYIDGCWDRGIFAAAVRRQLQELRYSSGTLAEYRGAVRILESIWG